MGTETGQGGREEHSQHWRPGCQCTLNPLTGARHELLLTPTPADALSTGTHWNRSPAGLQGQNPASFPRCRLLGLSPTGLMPRPTPSCTPAAGRHPPW